MINLNKDTYKKYKYIIWGSSPLLVFVVLFLFSIFYNFSGFLESFSDWLDILAILYFLSPYIVLFLIKYFATSERVISITNRLSIICCVLATLYLGFMFIAAGLGPLGGFLLFFIPMFQLGAILVGFVIPIVFKRIQKFYGSFS